MADSNPPVKPARTYTSSVTFGPLKYESETNDETNNPSSTIVHSDETQAHNEEKMNYGNSPEVSIGIEMTELPNPNPTRPEDPNIDSDKVEEASVQNTTAEVSGIIQMERSEKEEKNENSGTGGSTDSESSTQTDSESDSSSSSSSSYSSDSSYGSYMLTDSAPEFQNVLRTLKHYRRRRRRRTSSASSSSDSNCSCSSCDSDTDPMYFGTREGPHGGENTYLRRFCLWLESIKFMFALFVWGSLLVAGMFAGSAVIALRSDEKRNHEYGYSMLSWSIPTLVFTLLFFLWWRVTWHVLVLKGYAEGDQVVCRKGMIMFAQKKELVYSIRGAIYFGRRVNRYGQCKPEDYGVVGYENEYDSENYFHSDLERDGQYKKDIKPYRECEDPKERQKRNIYTTKAWYRDFPVVWWELWNHPPRDF
ncbi:hypothetical protein SK128_018971 [Halocaridina rubra]|uniref:Uncharacterized protein n=1 Tax=Halocaridina rubra TaxID=373956 RepID=A0AAN8X280_HALRR